MKKYIKQIVKSTLLALSVVACTDLDVSREDALSTGDSPSTREEFRIITNEMYNKNYWILDDNTWTDDAAGRANEGLNFITNGTVDPNNETLFDNWSVMYYGIGRALFLIESLDTKGGVLTDAEMNQFRGEAEFARASFWTYLLTHYGNIPFYENLLGPDEIFEVGQQDKEVVLPKIYEYYDRAIELLPESYGGGSAIFATKGAALAMKARAALYMGDYETAAEAAQDCMDLGVYNLHANYADLFYSSTKSSPEFIFQLARDVSQDVIVDENYTRAVMGRNNGGTAEITPSWSLLAAYEGIDGEYIDESASFDPRHPFQDRDPRCAMTIIPFGKRTASDDLDELSSTRFLGFDYSPHPANKTVINYSIDEEVRNDDTRSNINNASYTGLLLAKGVDEDYEDFNQDTNVRIIRYADVLLMYAEAKIELNQIDDSVLEAINEIRERAYAGSGVNAPTVTTTDQQELRLKVRNERRVELAFENLRYMDLIRWKLAEEALVGPIYGMLNVDQNGTNSNPKGDLIDKVVDPGLWFWGQTPQIDDTTGLPDFSGLLAADVCRVLNERQFDSSKQYLFPIPAEDRTVVPSLEQNPGYSN